LSPVDHDSFDSASGRRLLTPDPVSVLVGEPYGSAYVTGF
jgi:hypothetical protein